MNNKYILDENGQPALEPDLITWAKWFETADRSVASTTLTKYGVQISTVFLGLDHSFGGDTPILFETMIFGGEHDEWMQRYATREEALKGHDIAVSMINGTD